MIEAPTFQLPACPICSSVVALVRPFWKRARHSSAARGVECFTLVGCEHAAEFSATGRIHDDLEVIELVESAWAERAAQLFEARVANWPALAVDSFRRALDSRVLLPLPGITERLPFPPAPPAQQEPEPENQHGSS